MKKTPLRRKTSINKTKFEISEIKTPTRKASRSTIMQKADSAFSLFIRTRDSQAYEGRAFRCISCGRVLSIEQADCGHYVNRSHMSLRFSELNCNAQCRHCNRFQEGNFSGYRQGLIQKIGEPKVLLLEAQKNITTKITNFELEILAKHYRAETKKFKYQIK
ncbi:MAG: recombination protein NinG [Prevotella sp.]|nr:recombination protein NinG [Prevotella sp.]